MPVQKYDDDGNLLYGRYTHPNNRDIPSVAATVIQESNPLYDIPGMEYTNLQMRMTELQIAEKNVAFFANTNGGEELAKLYAEKVARLKGD